MENKEYRFKKFGGGSVRLKSGRIIKSNEIFIDYPDNIPEGVRDLIKPMNTAAEKAFEGKGKQPVPQKVEKKEYEIEKVKVGWYQIVADEKIISEKLLRKNEAIQMYKELSGEKAYHGDFGESKNAEIKEDRNDTSKKEE